MTKSKKKIIGFWGYPAPDLIKKYKKLFPKYEWLDLDVSFNAPTSGILPESYCKIIKNILDNALFFKDKIEVILAPIGKDKCDSGWFAATILKDLGFNVVTSIFEQTVLKQDLIISVSDLPLIEKVNLITKNIVEQKKIELQKCNPQFGFWGVPPNDLSLLELFPKETCIYGWLRCVEAGVPADINLEMFVDKNVPTVFYSQSFCAKAQLAKYLADKYNGLYIDMDDTLTNSVRCKVEAFIKLR